VATGDRHRRRRRRRRPRRDRRDVGGVAAGTVAGVSEGDGAPGAEATARRSPEFATDRLEAFSDGVMAVIITIMAFELKAPVGSSFGALQHELPALLVYILSFVYIGIYWVNH